MADLRSLRLLCNDPEAAARLLVQAKRGDVDAQYAIGLVYAEGRGVEPDDAQAFYWLSRAIDQGDEDARLLRDIIAMRMTADDFDAVDRLLAGQ